MAAARRPLGCGLFLFGRHTGPLPLLTNLAAIGSADHVLSKPVPMDALFDTLSEVIDGRASVIV